MIVKIITIDPKSKKPNQKVKCRDCGITYSFKDYAILYPLKKLNYLKFMTKTGRTATTAA